MRVTLCWTVNRADVELERGEILQSPIPMRVLRISAYEPLTVHTLATDVEFLLDNKSVEWRVYTAILPYALRGVYEKISREEAEKIIAHFKEQKGGLRK